MNPDKTPEFRTVRGYHLQNKLAEPLTPALEDYLEMAYRLCLEEKYMRVGRLSEKLHVRPSSASKMVLRLVGQGYLEYDRFYNIRLTEKGVEKGACLLWRHNTIEQFLKTIGNLDPLEEVELAEHSLSLPTLEQIQILLDFFKAHPDIEQKYQSFRQARLE